MLYKLTIHISIILTALLFSNEISVGGLEIKNYQTFFIILILFHVLFKINYVTSNRRLFKNGIIFRFRF